MGKGTCMVLRKRLKGKEKREEKTVEGFDILTGGTRSQDNNSFKN